MDEPKQTQGYYGGQIAAPVFKQIAERAANYLNIRPEDGGTSLTPDSFAARPDDRGPKITARSQ
jgi:hypothetical protein